MFNLEVPVAAPTRLQCDYHLAASGAGFRRGGGVKRWSQNDSNSSSLFFFFFLSLSRDINSDGEIKKEKKKTVIQIAGLLIAIGHVNPHLHHHLHSSWEAGILQHEPHWEKKKGKKRRILKVDSLCFNFDAKNRLLTHSSIHPFTESLGLSFIQIHYFLCSVSHWLIH